MKHYVFLPQNKETTASTICLISSMLDTFQTSKKE